MTRIRHSPDFRVLRADLIDPTVAANNGRVFKRTGDGVLVEFRSVVEAVRCAIEIQNAMVERNASVADDRRIVFRIGIHLGDVVEESDGDLMGDGVDIAARLEGVAKPGAICCRKTPIARSARLDLRSAISAQSQLKNIAEPVRLYSLQVGVRRASPAAGASTAPASEKPSIAVLAFQNMSGDPEQEYFADGITEDMITDLSKIGGLMVIARNRASPTRARRSTSASSPANSASATVLEGSIRRAGGRVRITAQLIDAADRRTPSGPTASTGT